LGVDDDECSEPPVMGTAETQAERPKHCSHHALAGERGRSAGESGSGKDFDAREVVEMIPVWTAPSEKPTGSTI